MVREYRGAGGRLLENRADFQALYGSNWHPLLRRRSADAALEGRLHSLRVGYRELDLTSFSVSHRYFFMVHRYFFMVVMLPGRRLRRGLRAGHKRKQGNHHQPGSYYGSRSYGDPAGVQEANGSLGEDYFPICGIRKQFQ